MVSHIKVLLLLCLLPLLAECGPWCFKCDNAQHPALCQEVIACGDHQYCYTERHSNNNGAETYSSGCKAIADCQTVVKRSVVHCAECCATTLCNEALCGAKNISSGTRKWCADCDLQDNPAACDHVNLCSQDQTCSVSKKTVFGFQTFDLGCEDAKSCQGKALTKDNQQCCDLHLCNTNLALVSPDQYTSPPPSTTTPTPVAATATINETEIDFVSHHEGNETLEITCLLSGFPTPNVTWYFTPDLANTTGNAGNATTGNNSITPSTSIAGSNSSVVNSTTGSNSTGNNSTGNGQGALTSMEITTGVTTTGSVSTLVITAPDAGDAGEYTCHVENSLGGADSAVTVTYAAAPNIAGASNETLQGQARDDVILDCDVDGSPPPTVEWQVPTGAGGVERLSNGSLLLHNVHADSDGDYVCLANNTAGSASKTFSLTVDDNSTAPCPTPAVLMTTLPPPTTTSTMLTTTTAQTTSTATPPPPITCPTLPITTTPQSTTKTTSPPAPSTTATTTPTTPTTTTTTPSTTSTTTTTTTPTTTTPSTTTATTVSTSSTTASPMVTTTGSLFKHSDHQLILQCNVNMAAGGTPVPPITWARQEANYDHADNATYNENGHGVLVITPQKDPLVTTGVYKCQVANGLPNNSAEFVVYTELPGPIDCKQEFHVGSPPILGTVYRTTCGPCQPTPLYSGRLIWRNQICNNAMSRNVITSAGGVVTWLLKANNEVELLVEENGHVVHKT